MQRRDGWWLLIPRRRFAAAGVRGPRRRFAAAGVRGPRRRFAAAGVRGPRRRFAAALGLCLLAACVLGTAGCGPVLYEGRIRAAEAKLNEAREANARWYAPYEYYYAEAHLRQARIEAAEASYEDALAYAQTAEEYGTRALRVTTTRRRAER